MTSPPSHTGDRGRAARGAAKADALDPDDQPHVIALPPLIYLTALIVGVIAYFIDPRPLFTTTHAGFWVGIVMVIGAVVVAVWARRTMTGVGTNVNPRMPATRIVSHGPYRFT